MIRTVKVQLKPNNKQKAKLIQSAGVARFAYNWALGRQQENYDDGGKFLSDNKLRKEFTQLKKQDEFLWLNSYSNNSDKRCLRCLYQVL